MSALNSSPTWRWERREKESTDSLLENCCRADLRCAMGMTSSSLGCASDTDMRNIKSILRCLRGNPGIMTVRPTTLNLEAVERAPVGSVLTYGDSDWAGDADRFSVSGTAVANLVGTRSPRRAEISQRSHSAVAKLSWSLHSLEPVRHELATIVELVVEVWVQCRGDERGDTTDPVL